MVRVIIPHSVTIRGKKGLNPIIHPNVSACAILDHPSFLYPKVVIGKNIVEGEDGDNYIEKCGEGEEVNASICRDHTDTLTNVEGSAKSGRKMHLLWMP